MTCFMGLDAESFESRGSVAGLPFCTDLVRFASRGTIQFCNLASLAIEPEKLGSSEVRENSELGCIIHFLGGHCFERTTSSVLSHAGWCVCFQSVRSILFTIETKGLVAKRPHRS